MTIRDEMVDIIARWLHQRSPCKERPWDAFTELYRDSMRNSAQYLLQQVAAEDATARAARPSVAKHSKPSTERWWLASGRMPTEDTRVSCTSPNRQVLRPSRAFYAIPVWGMRRAVRLRHAFCMDKRRPRDMTLDELRALPEVPEAEREAWEKAQSVWDLVYGRDFETADGRCWATVRGPDGRWYKGRPIPR